MSAKTTNRQIADVLDRVADLLESQEANPFRVQAYRTGAQTIRTWQEPVANLAMKGTAELRKLPGIGQGLATWITEFVETGRLSLLDRIEEKVDPVEIFSRVPGIGEKLAKEIHDKLHIDSLEELETAAHDGRLENLEGIGPRRIQGIQDSLIGMLSRSARRNARRLRQARLEVEKSPTTVMEEPSVKLLLEIDAEYRRRAEAGELNKITPRRFNPQGRSWLAVLRTRRDRWNFTALYSNTALAHKLNTTHDWVVIYYEQKGIEDQVTVVTGQTGALAGKRVVRGRENETRAYYAAEAYDLFR